MKISKVNSITNEEVGDLIFSFLRYPDLEFEEEISKATNYEKLHNLKMKLFPIDENILKHIRERVVFDDRKLIRVEEKLDDILIEEAKVEKNNGYLRGLYNKARFLTRSKDYILGKIIDTTESMKDCEELIDHTKKGTRNRKLLLQKIIAIGNNQN